MRKVDSLLKTRLLQQFPTSLLESIENHEDEGVSDSYSSGLITIYSHILDDSEIDETMLMSYITIDKNEHKMLEKYYDIEDRYVRFFSTLYETYGLYIFDTELEETFYQFSSRELKELCKASLREKRFAYFCIPELDMLIVGNYDLTFVVYYRKEERMTTFKRALSDSGLYFITEE